MSDGTAPAIRAELDGQYSDVEQIELVGTDTTHHRGLGQIGTVVRLVDMSAYDGCPRCGTDEMVLSADKRADTVLGDFYCTDIRCRHFVGNEVEYDMHRIRADEPTEEEL